MVHQRGLNPIYQVPFAKFCSGQICHIPHKICFVRNLFLKNFKPFKKHGIALLVRGNQYYHTEPF